MAERIYIQGESGGLEPLEEERFSTEDELQELIAAHPELLDGEQIRPGDPTRWLLITREKDISETSDSGARWSLDHLIVDQDAVPTLVEVKRGSNPEIRRTVVGQMLEYAAHAAQTWTADELRETFEETATSHDLDPNEELEKLVQSGREPDADGFWESVATNLDARRLRLLFIADHVPDELERIVEFLNAQMPNIEVLAVEIKRFRGEHRQTLVPRVIGRIAGSQAQGATVRRRKLDQESFFAEFNSGEDRNAAERLLEIARQSGASLDWGSRAVSVRVLCSLWKQPVTVAWLYPSSNPGPGWAATRDFTFGAGVLDYDPGPEEELSVILQKYVDSFRADPFGKPIPGEVTWAWSVPYDEAAQHIDLLVSRLEGVISELKAL